jgi:NAD(P)-dependent dehydrogenase (short-subunit alcohol dehydrogenase family)
MGEKGLFDLTGKVSVVTGAGSGLGRIFCEAMAEHGAYVVCVDINEEWATETASLVAKYGVKTLGIKADISKQDDVEALFLKVDQEFGRLDILFNNAGIATRGMKIHEMPLEDWKKVIDVNLTGTFLCMREGIKLMLRQGIGSIINISSVLGLVATDPDILATPNYVASKHGIIGLTKSAAAQYGPNNIRVNTIAPGFFGGTRLADVEKRDGKQRQASSGKVFSLTPIVRLGRPEELKGVAILLASDNASSFITGETFVVDGGWCAW